MKLNKFIVNMIFMILILGALVPVASYFFMGILIVFIIICRQEKVIWNHLMQNKILLLLIISTFLSSFFSELWYISIPFSILYIMKIIFSSIVSCYLDEGHVNKIIILLIGLGIIVSIVGIIQYFYSKGNMPESWVDSSLYNIDFRVYSTFFNPNILAVFLNLTILAGIVYNDINKDNNEYKIPAILCIVLSTICLMLTYSRNGWLSLCVSVLAISIFNKSYRKYIFIFPVGFILFDFLVDAGRLLPSNLVSDSSIEYRIKIWIAAIRIVKDNFIFGVGAGTVWEQIPLYSSEIKAYISHVHNIYLQKLVDTGILGLLIFFWFISYIWNRIKKGIYCNKDISFVILGFYIAILSNGLLDATSFQEQISIYLWTFIGISLANIGFSKTADKSEAS
ncbi:MAG: O-antigen ligase family protein [Tissierellales bacterium]